MLSETLKMQYKRGILKDGPKWQMPIKDIEHDKDTDLQILKGCLRYKVPQFMSYQKLFCIREAAKKKRFYS